jgi:hypothetical protein
MKYLLLCLTLVSLSASAQTVIEYGNGEVYTVGEDEKVFITQQNNLYSYHPYQKTVQFKKLWPSTKVDAPPYTPNPNPKGTQEWCEAHELHANGYTFDDQIWYRECDVTGDGQYNQCDWYEPTGATSFEETAWQDLCNNGDPWDGES